MSHTEFSVYLPLREKRRVDGLLSALFSTHSRSALARMVERGCVCVNGKIAKKGDDVARGDLICVEWLHEKSHIEAEDISLDVLWEDENFAVINKDAGINVHPVPGEGGRSGTLVNALLHRFQGLSVIGGVERPGIVHRLDKDTSGLLLIAKNDQTIAQLQKLIADRNIKKTYLALVAGKISEREGYIESYIGRDPNDRKKMTTLNPLDPKIAKTGFRVLHTIEGDRATLVEVDLMTGRTHQIRVHFASIGHPVIGDMTYGWDSLNEYFRKKYTLKRQWLHAYRLEFYLKGKHYRFLAPLKPDLRAVTDINS